MSIPNIYLVEPYNAYTNQQGGRKKHWMEVVEEQVLLQKIIADQIALQEAKEQQNQAPTTLATSTVGTAAAGAGGIPVYEYFHPELMVANFSATPLTVVAGLPVTFTNLTPIHIGDNYLWNFGDSNTSTDINPVHTYMITGSVTCSLQASSSFLGQFDSETKNGYITISRPTVSVAFTVVTSSNTIPVTASFTNTSTTNGGGILTYNWIFGDTTSSSLASPTHYYTDTGSYDVMLQVTESIFNSSSYAMLSGGITASV